MSAKSRDNHNRWRSVTIAFRVSPEENEQLNNMVKLTGLTKQQYLIDNMLQHQFIVFPNPRVHKALKEYFISVTEELKKLENTGEATDEYLAVLKFALQIYNGMNES